MANTGPIQLSRQRSSISRRRYLKFELLDQRRVLASIAGPLLGEMGPAPWIDSQPSRTDLRVVYLDFSSSPSGSATSELRAAFADGLISADKLTGTAFAGDEFATGEIVAGNGSLAYAARGLYLNQLDLETGSVASLEVPAPIRSAQLLADGRILALLDVPRGERAGETPSAADVVPGLIVVSFASGEWESVAEANPGGDTEASESEPVTGFTASLASGERGLLVPSAASRAAEEIGTGEIGSQQQVTLRSLYSDPDTREVVIDALPFQVAAGSRVFASSSGPLALISQPSDGGSHVSLWSTRADSPVSGSDRTLAGISDVLLFDDATSLVVARHAEGGIQVFDAANRFVSLHRFPDWTGPVALDAAREWLVGVQDDQTLEIFDLREGRTRLALPLEMPASATVGGLALADGGSRLVLSTSAGVAQLRLDRLEAQRARVRSEAATIDQLFGDYGSGDAVQNLASVASLQQGNIDPGSVSVDENELGALVAHLQVSGVEAERDVALHVEDERFVLDGHELRLAPEVAFDFEQEPEVRVEVVLTDASSGDSLARQTVVITVTDVDDLITDITLDRREIPERTPGYIVSPVRVMDEDSDDHTLTVDDSRFEIENGNLKLREGVFVSRSDQEEILVTITASDNSAPAIAFAKQFILTVTANDLPLHNESGPTDVNGDGHTDPLDALLVINILNQGGPTVVGDLSLTGDDGFFYDVNGDGRITPLDALIIINEINRRGGGQAESPSGSGGNTRGLSGEGEAAPLEFADAKEEPTDPVSASPSENILSPKNFPTHQSVAAGGAARRATNSSSSDIEPSAESSREAADPHDDFFSGLDSNVG